MSHRKPLRVLQATNSESARRNPYLAQLIEGLERLDVNTTYWSWKEAFFGRQDLVHIHWPDSIYRGRTNFRTIIKSIIFTILILRWKIIKIPIIWTAHNMTPHESVGFMEKFAENYFRSSLSLTILLNDSVKIESFNSEKSVAVVIPHGDYRDWFKEFPEVPKEAGRIAHVGFLRPYKGVEELLDAFAGIPNGSLSLHIQGEPIDRSYCESLESKASADPRVDFKPNFASDKELHNIVDEAQLVVLPYRHMYNSGAVLLALSLNRPVLVPRSPSMEQLQDEFGSEWVILFEGDLDSELLEDAIFKSNNLNGSPSMSNRGWRKVSQLHFDAYNSIL